MNIKEIEKNNIFSKKAEKRWIFLCNCGKLTLESGFSALKPKAKSVLC